MRFAVQRGKQLWQCVETDFAGDPTLVSEFCQKLPDSFPVHKAECPPQFANWLGDGTSDSFKDADTGTEPGVVRKKDSPGIGSSQACECS